MAKAKAVDMMIKIEVEQEVLPYVGMVKQLYESRKKMEELDYELPCNHRAFTSEKNKEYSKARDAYLLAQSALEDFIYNNGADNGIEE